MFHLLYTRLEPSGGPGDSYLSGLAVQGSRPVLLQGFRGRGCRGLRESASLSLSLSCLVRCLSYTSRLGPGCYPAWMSPDLCSPMRFDIRLKGAEVLGARRSLNNLLFLITTVQYRYMECASSCAGCLWVTGCGCVRVAIWLTRPWTILFELNTYVLTDIHTYIYMPWRRMPSLLDLSRRRNAVLYALDASSAKTLCRCLRPHDDDDGNDKEDNLVPPSSG
ncbi:hypothetical protein GGS23DRAFT_132875 [Durotheca rogersii]|uniref:uncharacterized protein n=1 Tax=Durotheca rogersii TaxID=419775 RepID=UPI00222033E4|nr:uncharacterized protein GGS23DRAFT_132875 [Durotheca rogersii]KAI5861817.1 hypothetical protein GGS23DRAFT_132875 [Durotheca rogersii]